MSVYALLDGIIRDDYKGQQCKNIKELYINIKCKYCSTHLYGMMFCCVVCKGNSVKNMHKGFYE